jgi:hypothetical protein
MTVDEETKSFCALLGSFGVFFGILITAAIVSTPEPISGEYNARGMEALSQVNDGFCHTIDHGNEKRCQDYKNILGKNNFDLYNGPHPNPGPSHG